jgi:hypothetical protein
MKKKKERECDYCETPNCELPCHNPPKLKKKARIEEIQFIGLLSNVKTVGFEGFLIESENVLNEYGAKKIVDKINEIIKVINSR